MVDKGDLKSPAVKKRVGSSPTPGTNHLREEVFYDFDGMRTPD